MVPCQCRHNIWIVHVTYRICAGDLKIAEALNVMILYLKKKKEKKSQKNYY